MKVSYPNSSSNIQKPIYDFKANSVTEEHKISSPAKDSKKVISIQKDSLLKSEAIDSTVKKESSFANFNWEDAIDKESVSFSLESTAKKDPELYKQYLKTFDGSSQGLKALHDFDEFV